MASEVDNARLAFAWINAHHEAEALLRMSSVYWGLWHARGLYREGLNLVEQALAQSRPTATVARVQALDGAGTLARFQGNYARAAMLSDEEQALAQELGDPFLIGIALCNAGFLTSQQHGEYGQAEALFAEALSVVRAAAIVDLEGWANLWIGDMALVQGHFDRAAAHYGEALDILQATEWDWGLVDVQAGLGGVCFCMGDLVQAAAHYGESLERARDLGVEMLAVGALLGLAGVAAESGSPEQGARLFGAAEGIMASLGAPVFPRDHPARDRGLAALTEMLSEHHLAEIREMGRTLAFAQAVAEGRTVAATIATLPR